jgi:hypothetical protein
MNDLTIPPFPDPWTDLPEQIERLRAVAVAHQRRWEECLDHSIDACTCGVSGHNAAKMPMDVFNAGPAAMAEWRGTIAHRIRHDWRWLDHFRDEWNAAVAGVAVQQPPDRWEAGVNLNWTTEVLRGMRRQTENSIATFVSTAQTPVIWAARLAAIDVELARRGETA